MRARAVVFALVAAAAVSGGVIFVSKIVRARSSSLRSTNPDATTISKAQDSTPNPGAPDPSNRIDSSAERRPSGEATADAADSSTSTPVDGVLIVTDSRGVEHPSEDGSFDPWFFEIVANPDPRSDPPCDRGEPVEVHEGRFHLEVPAHRRVGASSIVVRGREALVDSAPADVDAGRPIAIRAHWPRGVRLRVVDRATNAELDQVDVHQWVDDDHGVATFGTTSSCEKSVIEHGVSPILLDAATVPLRLEVRGLPWQYEVSATLRIRAADHAWKTVEIDFEGSSERTIELEPAATLVVEVRGELPGRSGDAGGTSSGLLQAEVERPFLRLREYEAPVSFDEHIDRFIASVDAIPADQFDGGIRPTHDELRRQAEPGRDEYEAHAPVRGDLIRELPATSGETTFESLKPGECEVALEFGPSSNSRRAGHATTTLEAGRTTRVTLVPMAIESPAPNLRPRVPLAGTLFVGTGWPQEELRLDISPAAALAAIDPGEGSIPLSQMLPIAERPGWYRWRAGSVTPSTYLFAVEDAAFRRERMIPVGGDEDVEIILPEAATLEVRIVEKTSGAVLPLAPPEWIPDHDPDDEWIPREYWTDFQKDPDGKRYFAHVPVGPGHFFDSFGQLDGWVLDEESSHADIHPGTQELTLEVHRACGVVLQFTCDGAPVWWESDYGDVLFSTVDDEPWSRPSTIEHHLRRYTLEKPGHYSITFERIPGFDAVPPVEVDVPAETFITTTIELKRR
jgi:hypothetical protein